MKNHLRTMVPYLAVAILLSGVDFTYEWHSPVPVTQETGTTHWYSAAGLRRGAIVLANREPAGPPAGLQFNIHVPQLPPMPFFASAGPEGGGIGCSVWFLSLALWSAHGLWRTIASAS